MREGEEWLPAPVNAVGAPPRRETDRPAGSVDIPVLARLVWPRDRVQVVPALALRWSRDRVLVSWRPQPRSSSRTRSTWLPIGDVRLDWCWVIRRSGGAR